MSKFDKIFKAREEEPSEKEPANSPNAEKVKTEIKAKSSQKTIRKAASREIQQETPEVPIASTAGNGEKKRGRPTGKRTDPAFIGFTTYIRKDTHLKAKIALLQEGKGKELSELVEELIGKWLNTK